MKKQKPLTEMLPVKQQTLDFGTPTLWQQLSPTEQQRCQSAIADLIHQVAKTQSASSNRSTSKADKDHE